MLRQPCVEGQFVVGQFIARLERAIMHFAFGRVRRKIARLRTTLRQVCVSSNQSLLTDD